MLVSLFVGPVYFLVQMFIWKAVYASGAGIKGLTLDQMLTYFGFTALINYLIMDFADWNLQMLIQTGKFLTFMLRPLSHIYFAFSQKIGHRILGFILEFLPVYLIFFFIFRIRIIPAKPAWGLASIILGFIMMFLVDYCVGITAFWLTRTTGVRRTFLVLRDVCSGVMFPLSLLPDIFQKAFFFLPFQYIVYVPVRTVIGSYQLAGFSLSIPQIVGIQAAAVGVMAVLTMIFFNQGIKRFTGVGT